MSKGNSGLFKNTKGFQNFQRVIQKSAYMEIIKTVIKIFFIWLMYAFMKMTMNLTTETAFGSTAVMHTKY